LAPAVAQNKPKTYCNPLPLPSYPVVRAAPGGLDYRSLADPTVIKYGGKWYLYPSYEMAWVSEDLINWEHVPMKLSGAGRGSPFAPTVLEHNGSFYLTANGTGLYRSSDPLGPWEYAGDIKDQNGKKVIWVDPMLFADDDGKIYAYYGSGNEGIWAVELDPLDLTRFRAPARNCFRFEPSHLWERWGEKNEFDDRSWIEGAWVTKNNGRYYLQYSAPGTEWKNYSVGVYTSTSPLGPFTYDARNPILCDRGGLINGTGHHSVVEGPDGGLWAIYTVLYRNRHKFERRLALDPVGFDRRGNMVFNGPSETPQWAPGVKKDAWLGNDAGSIPLSIDKDISASTTSPGRDAVYAIDNNVRTWWEAQEGDPKPSLKVDLGREFSIEAARILFSDAHLDSKKGVLPGPFQFKLEASSDDVVYRIVWDKTKNTGDRNIEYGEFPAQRSRYVRLTVTGGPSGLPVGILEFTVFGVS
jgi:xylan 1,4-beta-xylosidase